MSDELSHAQSVLRQGLEECGLHEHRLRRAIEKARHAFPLTPEAYKNLDEDFVQLIDHLLFRFLKLQDAAGDRVFRALLECLGEDTRAMAMTDRLNRLEQLGAIESADGWLYLRTLRNKATHEYVDDPVENTANLNEFYAESARILSEIDRVREFARARGLA